MSLEPISLRLQGRGGWLHPGSYLVAVRAFWGMLRNLDLELSKQPRGSVDWEISALKKSGPALVVFIGHLKTPPKDIMPEIKRAVVDGVRTISQGEARHLLGQRVAVHGTMRRNYLDEPILLEGEGYEEWPQSERLPSIASMSGRISKLTGELSVRDYIVRLRDD